MFSNIFDVRRGFVVICNLRSAFDSCKLCMTLRFGFSFMAKLSGIDLKYFDGSQDPKQIP